MVFIIESQHLSSPDASDRNSGEAVLANNTKELRIKLDSWSTGATRQLLYIYGEMGPV
jgi:hypothetical protein